MRISLTYPIIMLLYAIVLISLGCQSDSDSDGNGLQKSVITSPTGDEPIGNNPTTKTNIGMDETMSAKKQKDALRSNAQHWVELYIQEAKASGFDPSFIPSVIVKTTPGIIFYRGGYIVIPFWEELGQKQKDLFNEWASWADNGITGEELFEEWFNWFAIAHEMTHYLQHSSLLTSLSRYDSEKMANEFAVAFWLTQEDFEERLTNLIAVVRPILANLDDPTPEGENFENYFNRNYTRLVVIPQKYQYYQFKQVVEAFDNRDSLDFNTLVQLKILKAE